MRVIIDSREKQPWTITHNEHITEVESSKLDTGDYSVEGLEGVFAIERKASVQEIANNITKDHFWEAMRRLEGLNHPFMICEFPISHIYMFPEVPGIPKKVQKVIKITPAFIMGSLIKLMGRGVQIIFAENAYYGEKIGNNILTKVIRNVNKSR